MSAPVVIFATFVPKLTATGSFLRLMELLVDRSRLETGCLVFDLYAGDGDFHLFEIYATREALEAHRASDHYKQYRSNVQQLLEQDIDVTEMNPVNVRSTNVRTRDTH